MDSEAAATRRDGDGGPARLRIEGSRTFFFFFFFFFKNFFPRDAHVPAVAVNAPAVLLAVSLGELAIPDGVSGHPVGLGGAAPRTAHEPELPLDPVGVEPPGASLLEAASVNETVAPATGLPPASRTRAQQRVDSRRA